MNLLHGKLSTSGKFLLDGKHGPGTPYADEGLRDLETAFQLPGGAAFEPILLSARIKQEGEHHPEMAERYDDLVKHCGIFRSAGTEDTGLSCPCQLGTLPANQLRTIAANSRASRPVVTQSRLRLSTWSHL
jgi:hypothetical protein